MARVSRNPATEADAPAEPGAIVAGPPEAFAGAEPPDMPTAYRVISTRPGMWRGGRQWPADSLVPAADMPPDTLAALHGDATFRVVPVFADAAEG